MHTIITFLEHLHVDVPFGGGGKSIDLINSPQGASLTVTPNRRELFKCFNYTFKNN